MSAGILSDISANILATLVIAIASAGLALFFRYVAQPYIEAMVGGAWRTSRREWFIYYLSIWEERPAVKAGILRIRGWLPLATKASIHPLEDKGFIPMREYVNGSIRIAGSHMNIRIVSKDPPADLYLVFRTPTTSMAKGYTIGTMASITLPGDPCAAACILSTHKRSRDELKRALAPFKNFAISSQHDRVTSFSRADTPSPLAQTVNTLP